MAGPGTDGNQPGFKGNCSVQIQDEPPPGACPSAGMGRKPARGRARQLWGPGHPPPSGALRGGPALLPPVTSCRGTGAPRTQSDSVVGDEGDAPADGLVEILLGLVLQQKPDGGRQLGAPPRSCVLSPLVQEGACRRPRTGLPARHVWGRGCSENGHL